MIFSSLCSHLSVSLFAARSIFTNLMIPRCLPLFWAYPLLPVVLLLAVSLGGGFLFSILTNTGERGYMAGFLVLYYALFFLLFRGFSNPHNQNDNTSGVAAVMELMQRIPAEQRAKTAFILFDNEEKGMLGSSAYASSHKAVKREKLIINMDCVGDGEHVLFFANKKTRSLESFPKLEAAMQSAQGRNFMMNKMEKCVYPSDQSQFKHGIAVCASNKMPVIGYYCDKIHTKKDTVCEQVNLDFLAQGLSDFVSQL